MKQPGQFLTAEWRNVLLLNYAVQPSLLKQYIPSCTELDFFEDQAYVSLVGFQFNRTRVLGVPIPFHQAFEEVNLRFYVKRRSRRGVTFIKELVPKYAVRAVARLAFGENYARVPMSHHIRSTATGQLEANYSWGSQSQQCSMRMETEGASFLPAEGSLAQFIAEHYWGYTMQSNGGCLEYEVQHLPWRLQQGKITEFCGDSAHYYGEEFAKVLINPPDSAFLAEGSPVTVFKGTRIA